MIGKNIITVKDIDYGANKVLPEGRKGTVTKRGTDGWIATFPPDVKEIWLKEYEFSVIEPQKLKTSLNWEVNSVGRKLTAYATKNGAIIGTIIGTIIVQTSPINADIIPELKTNIEQAATEIVQKLGEITLTLLDVDNTLSNYEFGKAAKAASNISPFPFFE